MRAMVGTLRFVAGVVISIIMAGLEIIMLPVDSRRGRVFHALARFWARTVLSACGVRVRVSGLDRVDFSKNYVYVSNHASMLDIPVILAGIPDQIRIIYKKELEAIPVFGWGLKWGSYVGIDRGRSSRAMRSLAEAIEKIRRGASVLLYAEGTRTLDGKLQLFKRGAFNLAVKAGVPVVPLIVNGSYGLLRKRSIVIHPGIVDLILESPIPVEGLAGKEFELHLMEQVHAAIARHYVDQS
jgi:1-acyl-sn-glycerol-3-phosphate acyltransferase